MPVTRLFEHASDARVVPAKTTIFGAGEPRDYMYAVLDGAVDIFVGGQLVETVEKGGIFGEMALIAKDTRGATAIARSDARIVQVDEQRFLFLVQQTPNFSLHVMRVLSERLRRMNDRLVRTPAGRPEIVSGQSAAAPEVFPGTSTRLHPGPLASRAEDQP